MPRSICHGSGGFGRYFPGLPPSFPGAGNLLKAGVACENCPACGSSPPCTVC